MTPQTRLGIVDLGSNSSRLSIYDILEGGQYRPVYEIKQSVRLAHYMTKDGSIQAEGIARAVFCTRLFVRIGKQYEVSSWTAVATAAVRQAKNQEEILTALKDEGGLEFSVLPGEEEGRYGFLGVVNTLDITDALLFDVGGASTEISLVQNRQLTHVVSLPVGALNLRERFSSNSESEAAKQARNFAATYIGQISWLKEAVGLPLVGLGGTARAIAKLDISQSKHESQRLHGYVVEPQFVTDRFQVLQNTSVSKRRKIKGISKTRADILVSGLAIVDVIIEKIVPTKVIVSRYGLREGLFFEHYLRDNDTPVLSSVLEHSIDNFQKIYGVQQNVARLVTDTALELFDALKTVYPFTAEHRRLLWVAAQIESGGCYINTEKWTRHSAYLALSSYLYGLTSPELVDVAALLSQPNAQHLRQLTIIMRLAQTLIFQLGVDIDTAKLDVLDQQLLIASSLTSSIDEMMSFSPDIRILDDFKEAFGLDVIVTETTV